MQVRTSTTIYVPTGAAVFEFRGKRVEWIGGRTTIEEGHPILKGRMHMVRPLEVDYPAEQKDAA